MLAINMEDKYSTLEVERVTINIKYDESLEDVSKKDSITGAILRLFHENGLCDEISVGSDGAKLLDDMVKNDEYTHVGSNSSFKNIEADKEHTPDYPSNWKQFKKQIITRDKNECQNCGCSGSEMVDQIVPTIDRGNFVLTNFVTLCATCHQNKNQEADSTTSKYPDNWDTIRKEVYKKDNYKCKNCGINGGIGRLGNAVLNAHHIVPRSKGGNDRMNNLVTLCNACHESCHDHM